jgi:hypothetical protein
MLMAALQRELWQYGYLNAFGGQRRDEAIVKLYALSRWREESGTCGSSGSSAGTTAG